MNIDSHHEREIEPFELRNRVISRIKLSLYGVMIVLACADENRLRNIPFVIILFVLIICNIVKIVTVSVKGNPPPRIAALFGIWIAEIILTSASLTALYGIFGFDFGDIFAIFATFIVIGACIAETAMWAELLKSAISPDSKIQSGNFDDKT